MFIVILYGFCFFVCCPSHQLKSSLQFGATDGLSVGARDLAGLDTKLLALGHLFHDSYHLFQGVIVFLRRR